MIRKGRYALELCRLCSYVVPNSLPFYSSTPPFIFRFHRIKRGKNKELHSLHSYIAAGRSALFRSLAPGPPGLSRRFKKGPAHAIATCLHSARDIGWGKSRRTPRAPCLRLLINASLGGSTRSGGFLQPHQRNHP